MGLIKFLFIAICIMWLIRILVRLLMPYIFGRIVRKTQERMQNPYNTQQRHYQQYKKPEGKVHIDYIPQQDPEAKAADEIGEFVDFEEIKEK